VEVGAENRNKLIAAVVLGVLALGLVGRWMFMSGSSNAAAPSAPAVAPAAGSRVSTVGRKVGAASLSLDPTLRFDWLRASEDTKYTGTGRNIFLAAADIPKPTHRPNTDNPMPPPPPPGPPPPPPINLVFFGFASKPGEPKKVFLSQGGDVFIAGEGEIVDRRYKISRITAVSVEVEDVLNNNRQSIPLTQTQ
jgi:hypothetical protein